MKKSCTALVCSCYVSSRNINGRDNQEIVSRNVKIKQSCGENKDYLGNQCNGDRDDGNGNGNDSNGFHCHVESPPINLKSNLKKKSSGKLQENEVKSRRAGERRKVSWSDAHGKDIAHVHEFEHSVSEDGELGVAVSSNSCICSIQ